MKALAQQLVERLVDNPNDVSIKEDRQNGIIKLSIKVNRNDVGKVIGKSGRTITSLRTLFKAISVKENKKLVEVTMAE